MNRHWVKVLIAAIFEVAWVVGLKHANNGLEWAATAAAIAISFYGMLTASKHLPVGTVYAVFVGLGTAGTVLVDLLIFGDEWKPIKLILLVVLLSGVLGLKLVSNEGAAKEGS